MFGFDERLAYMPPIQDKIEIVDINYSLFNGTYFSPFNTTRDRNRLQDRQDRDNNKIVCWYEGLCYEYEWPKVPAFEEQKNLQKCHEMTKFGKWNVAPYWVGFRKKSRFTKFSFYFTVPKNMKKIYT